MEKYLGKIYLKFWINFWTFFGGINETTHGRFSQRISREISKVDPRATSKGISGEIAWETSEENFRIILKKDFCNESLKQSLDEDFLKESLHSGGHF